MIVRNVITHQDRDITEVCNQAVRPVAFLGMLLAESGLDELSWRDRRDLSECDVSGNLPHLSICTAMDLGLIPSRQRITDEVVAAYKRLCVGDDTTPPGTLRMLAEPELDLLCCCLWNAPNAPGRRDQMLASAADQYGWDDPRVRDYVARYWLGTPAQKYLTNRANYTRALVLAQRYVVEAPVAEGETTWAQDKARIEEQISLLVENQRRILMGKWDEGRIFLDAIDPSMKGKWTNVPFPKGDGSGGS
jgi:hypothetical protein